MTDSMEQMESQSTGLPAKRAKGSIKGGRRVPFPVELDKALPKYDGPKLDAFQHHDATIEFISLLSAESPGDDAHVFEVVIQSKHYALKVFKFFEPPSDPDGLRQLRLSQETYAAQFDPFYAEFRAYGCIERNRRNGEIAARCYGFTAVPAEREYDLAALPFEVDEWDRPEKEYDLPIAQRQPFRAIVKELVRHRRRLARVPQMREDLLALQEMGVYVQDVKQDNYVNGKLVDFSISWTKPHAMLDSRIRSQNLINKEIQGNLRDFDRMVEEAGILVRHKAAPEPDQASRLRTRIKKPERFRVLNLHKPRRRGV